MKGVASIVPVLLLAACAGAPANPPAAPASELLGTSRSAPADGFELRMRRSGCFGSCPSYEVVIHADGRVDYFGSAHVAAGGARQGQADGEALARLRRRLDDAALPWGDYVRGTPGCGAWATDMPGATIDAWVDGRWRSIRHDFGCSAAPAELKALEQDIDAAALSEQWVSGRVRE